jgi:hypothetical protein
MLLKKPLLQRGKSFGSLDYQGIGGFRHNGHPEGTAQLFYDFDLERPVPSGHMLREIDRFLDMDGMREAVARGCHVK